MSRYVDETLESLVQRDRISRRKLLQYSAVSGAALGLAGVRVIDPFVAGVGAQEASPVAGEPVSGGALRAGFEANPDDLNPFTMSSLVSALVTEQVYDTLFIFDDSLASQPNLCVNFEAPDELTYRFTIADNALFSDGTAVTSEDVKFTLEGYKNPELGGRGWAQAIDTIDIVDATTVQVNLLNPFAPMIGYLSWHYNPIISKAFYEANEGNLQTVTMGSGPFILQEFTPDQSIKFVKNPNYWQDGLPYLDEMEWVVLPDDQARVAALRGGEVANGDFLDFQPVESFINNPDFTVYQVSTLTHATTVINCSEGPLADARVRQAMSYAIDRNEFLQTAALGYGQVTGYIPAADQTWSVPVDQLPTYATDVEKAKALMEEAGYADGFEVTLRVSPLYILDTANAQVLQQQLQSINITVNIEQLEWGNLLDAWVNLDFELLNILLLGQPDPDGYTWGRYHSTSPTNRNQIADPELDALLDEARATVDFDTRRALYADVQQKLDTLVPNLFYYVYDVWLIWDPRYQGITPMPNASAPYMKRVWINQ